MSRPATLAMAPRAPVESLVLIYFNRALQERVHRLLYSSLGRFGFLALGSKETVRFTPHEDRYQEMPGHIWRKVA